MNASPLNIAATLAPVPDRENASKATWVRHYAATAFAAYAQCHHEISGLPPHPAEGSRPDLGYLAALGNAAFAAAYLLANPGDTAGLWEYTPEQGALNGEWEEWLADTLDEHGINPADIDPRYNSGDFRSPMRAVNA